MLSSEDTAVFKIASVFRRAVFVSLLSFVFYGVSLLRVPVGQFCSVTQKYGTSPIKYTGIKHTLYLTYCGCMQVYIYSPLDYPLVLLHNSFSLSYCCRRNALPGVCFKITKVLCTTCDRKRLALEETIKLERF